MHFWIDKRSQVCGFGRARVAASLSGTRGMGIGFGHPPRRISGKSSLSIPLHRPQNFDNINRSQMSTAHYTNNQNPNINTASGANINTLNRNFQVNQTQNNTNLIVHREITNSNNNNHQYYLQQNFQRPPPIVARNCQNLGENVQSVNLQHLIHANASVNSHEQYFVSAPLTHTYRNATPSLDMDHLTSSVISHSGNNLETEQEILPNRHPNSQLLSSHLKCGMWASLVMASVFIAGAKFYFDHQGTGLEVLIFCALSATFFLAACTVSLCRLPRDIPAVTTRTAEIENSHQRINLQNQENHQQNFAQNYNQRTDVSNTLRSLTISTPPPPYHIAIHLPHNSKNSQLDDTPPPSYDKVII